MDMFALCVNIFIQIHLACHNDANRIKPGSNLKMTDVHAVGYSKDLAFEHKLIFLRCMNCSYNNIARTITLPDKNRHLRLYRPSKLS